MQYTPEQVAELLATFPNPQDPKGFRAVAVNCAHTAFRDVIKHPGSTSDVIEALEDLILQRINDHRPDDDVKVSVVAKVGAHCTTYEIVITNNTLDKQHTITLDDGTTVQESIDPAPITKKMAQQSSRTIDLTLLIQEAMKEAYLEAEPFEDTGKVTHAIYEAITKKMADVEWVENWVMEAAVDINGSCTVEVEVPGVAKVRLRATRKPELPHIA